MHGGLIILMLDDDKKPTSVPPGLVRHCTVDGDPNDKGLMIPLEDLPPDVKYIMVRIEGRTVVGTPHLRA